MAPFSLGAALSNPRNGAAAQRRDGKEKMGKGVPYVWQMLFGHSFGKIWQSLGIMARSRNVKESGFFKNMFGPKLNVLYFQLC